MPERQWDEAGFVTLPRWMDKARCDELLSVLGEDGAVLRRNLVRDPSSIRDFIARELAPQIESFGRAQFFPVRALLFDKTPDANWKVAWHQDLSIAVAERRATPGFTGWSLKEGVWHVQPPACVLERMITLRIHLDNCGPDNGPLKVIPGSHCEGRLSRERIEWWKTHCKIVECHVPAGGALLMRPLLLHASSPAMKPSHRRVLHVEFAAETLPAGLRWAEERPSATTSDLSLPTPAPTLL
jgi:ectoine hydroxylase-related dioxygenase (phytanoyl-CoA dioxygenase family)